MSYHKNNSCWIHRPALGKQPNSLFILLPYPIFISFYFYCNRRQTLQGVKKQSPDPFVINMLQKIGEWNYA